MSKKRRRQTTLTGEGSKRPPAAVDKSCGGEQGREKARQDWVSFWAFQLPNRRVFVTHVELEA
jgi:hypothetical protein